MNVKINSINIKDGYSWRMSNTLSCYTIQDHTEIYWRRQLLALPVHCVHLACRLRNAGGKRSC